MRQPRKPTGPRPVTASYLRHAAVHYLGTRAASRAMLEQTLERRAARRLGERRVPEVTRGEIVAVVAEMVALGLVDDAAYGAARARTLTRQGLAGRRIAAGLRQKGLAAEVIEAAIAPDLDELAQARRYAERKRLGPWRSGGSGKESRERDLRALARAGFGYAVAAAALAAEPE